MTQRGLFICLTDELMPNVVKPGHPSAVAPCIRRNNATCTQK